MNRHAVGTIKVRLKDWNEWVRRLEGRSCSSCENPYHPATGWRLSPRTRLCGPCARHFAEWVKGMVRRRWGGVRFYDHAATSVRAP